MKKRLMSVVILLAILITVTPFASSAADIFFVAYNDTVPLTLSGGDGLLSYKDVLLGPHTVFTVNGVNLTPVYDAEEKTMTIYSRTKRLEFDLTEGLVTDETGRVRSTLCAYRNQVVFLPLTMCAEHFGFNVSVVTSREGYAVLRFTNGSQLYDDAEFISKAENLISYRVQRYLEEQGKPPVVEQPEDPPSTDDPPVTPETPDRVPPTVYLAVTDASYMREALQMLRAEKIPAVFFLTAEEIRKDPTLVRSIRASDYPVGITVERGELSVAEGLRQANEALDDVIQAKTLLALLDREQKMLADGYFVIDQSASVSAREAGIMQLPCLVVCQGDLRDALAVLSSSKPVFRRLRETTRF